MLTFNQLTNGLYLASDAGSARVAFVSLLPSPGYDTFQLSNDWWISLGYNGYFVFFPPAARDPDAWSAFATNVRAVFALPGAQNAQFGWFPTDTAVAADVPLVFVSRSASPGVAPSVLGTNQLRFRNIAFFIQGLPSFQSASIQYDDIANNFVFANQRLGNVTSIALTVAVPPSTSPTTYPAQSASMLLPLQGALVGCVQADVALAESDLALFEAGIMYFAGPATPGDPLTALRYPVFHAPAALQFSVCLDWLTPVFVPGLDGEGSPRSFFLFTDATVGSYFVQNPGTGAFDFNTVDVATAQALGTFPGCLVLANRPFNQTTDSLYYYLTPAGLFDLSSAAGGAGPGTAALVCGVSGTELFAVGLGGAAPDSFNFVAGQAAYQLPPATAQPTSEWLSDEGGNVTTAWVEWITRPIIGTNAGAYIAQPNQSPLYHQTDGGTDTNSGLSVYLLSFNQLPVWSPLTSTIAPVNGSSSTPAVPLAPYAGIAVSTTDALAPFTQMDSAALAPTRSHAFAGAVTSQVSEARAAADGETLEFSMTPQGLLAGFVAGTNDWSTLQIAISGDDNNILQFTSLATATQQAFQRNQTFLVVSRDQDGSGGSLFGFTGANAKVTISDWAFDLTLPHAPPDSATTVPQPILIFKLFPGRSIAALVNDVQQWTSPSTFNADPVQIQSTIKGIIDTAMAEVEADPSSIFSNFCTVVNNQAWTGVLALNGGIDLQDLPPAIRALLGGMVDNSGKSLIDTNFFAHHVGVPINDTQDSSTPALSQSSLFAVVDYEGPTPPGSPPALVYSYQVQYLRVLFLNSSLNEFDSKVNLTINNLFDVNVNLNPGGTQATADGNLIVINGSYQAQSTNDPTALGVYSFVADGAFEFTFADNTYLKSIELTKVQFSAEGDAPVGQGSDASQITAQFAIWGSLVFNELDVLDIFSFEKLTFAGLGIGVTFDLNQSASPPVTNLGLDFQPGDLRLDLADSPPREGTTSLLGLLPFKLSSFLYSQNHDQKLDSLDYIALSKVPGLESVADTFNYAFIFDLDLGSLGGLVGSLSAFKFSAIIGWLNSGGVAIGFQLPSANGKLEISIEGILTLSIGEFQLQYQAVEGSDPAVNILSVVLFQSYMEILGTRLPPTGSIDFALFAPQSSPDQIGWIVAYDNEGGGDAPAGTRLLPAPGASSRKVLPAHGESGASDEGDSSAFELLYLGLGQRVGPSAGETPTTFQGFLDFMTKDFQEAVTSHDYAKVYQPTGGWLAVGHMKILGMVEFGLVFYDTTPFYSLTLNVVDLFDFEITYTKISDSIGMFFANLALPDSLRTFQVGVASLTLPSLGITVFTNGNWKIDVGFPANDDWSRAFQVQAQAGPVPITGAGGFYLASLSSATDPDIFQNTYPSIIAFGFGARLGVGKDFTAGPLKAGVSVTFFGIIEGAAGYLTSSSTELFQKPNALSLKGQFGLIGQIYGSVDFKIIKASVNVTLQASIGIVLVMEDGTGNDGSILLYIEASVSVSASVSINLGLFSISISFGFKMSVRFDWQLTGSSGAQAIPRVEAARAILAAGAALALPAAALYPGLNAKLPLLYLPEITVVFPSATGVGDPWFVCSLAIPYADSPPANPAYSDFQPFEALVTQLSTWVLVNVLGLAAYNSTVTQDEIAALDSDPATLVGQVDYPSLLAQLAVFQANVVAADPSKPSPYPNATPFAMPPFLTLSTSGRTSDLDYTFASNNVVSQDYIDTTLQDYFNQLYVNQTSQASGSQVADTTTVPLAQAVFLDYFTGLIRGAVHALLQTMQDADLDSSPLDKLFQAAVGTGQIKTLAGQTASYFRGGARLPYTAGMTLPTGPAAAGTNSLYGLLWQEFPVGATTTYTITLSNVDTTQPWLQSAASFALTSAMVSPYQNLTPQVLTQPGPPTEMPYLNSGGQSFAFQNAVAWNNGTTTASLRAFPTSLASLQQAQGTTPINAIVASRETGAAYLPGGTALPTSQFTWATQITLSVKPTPGGAPHSPPLKNTFNVTGGSQEDQLVLEQILQSAIPQIASVQVLYQNAQSGSAAVGLNSAPVTPDNVFVLRTNTTTVSVPPSVAMATFAAPTSDPVPVGATIAEVQGFLQILEQAVVTNAPGYYLYYEDNAGDTLPPALFTAGAAPLTILISYNPSAANDCQTSAQIQPWYNAIVLASADPTLLYYAVTTDAALDTQYPAVAPGSVSIQLTRDNDSAQLTVPRSLASKLKDHPALDFQNKHTPAQLHRALLDAGVTDPHQMDRLLAEAGASNTQLNALYSVLAYQAGPVSGGTGYITSNLSSPIQPQTPPPVPTCPVGTPPPPDSTSNNTYVVSVPIANIATGNQPLQSGIAPDPYASLNLPYAVSFFLTDVFGNQVPVPSAFSANNLYFDGLIAVDQWQGVPTTYDFGAKPVPGGLVVYLTPSAAAFPSNMSSTQIAAAATLYQNILDQITAVNAVTQKPTVSFHVETNLAVNADGTMVQIALDAGQTSAIVGLVSGMIAYLNGRAADQSTSLPAPVALAVSVGGAGALPPLFEIAVTIGIQRDPSMVVPEVLNSYPPAQNVSSTVAPASASTSNLTQFASDFQTAFSTMVMAVSMNGVQAPQDQSTAGRARKRLRAAGLPGDGTGSGSPGPQSLWALQNALTSLTIGANAASPLYISPKPLSNNLQSGTVPLPVLPPVLEITLPASQLFTDVDLDLLNEQFFQSVDTVLAPASATAGFQAAPGAYTTITQGRELIAEGYSTNEVDWLFPAGSPFQGIEAQLETAQDALQQQMRAALMSAYAIDTIVEYPVTWNGAVPPAVGDQVSLFGQVAPTANSPVQPSDGYTFSTSEVAVDPSGTGLFTFLFGALNVADAQSIVTPALQYTITHIEYFLQPASDTPPGEARPSMWLQLVTPIVKGVSSTGQTQIPVVFRQYPTLPSLMSQTWTAKHSLSLLGESPNPLVSAAGWYFDFQYQAQLTPHDQILARVTYNTDLKPSTGGGAIGATDDEEAQQFSLWEALARWSAVYTAIQPTLSSIPPNPNNASDPATMKWQAALSAFADCVTEVVNNTDWNPPLTAFVAEGLQHVTDNYTITDVAMAQAGARQISLVWSASQGPSHFPGVTLGVLGIAPDGTPYANQTPGTITNGITDQYTPSSPIVNDWVQHQVQVNALNVLVQENAQAGLQIERNDITLAGYTVQPEFIYTTPVVSFSQPVTPFVENTTPIDITTLPDQGTAPNPPCVDAAPNSLCQRIYTMLYDLLFSQEAASALLGAYRSAGVDSTDRFRRMKLQANFQYPIASGAGGAPGAPSVIVSTPVVLARSFNIDVTTTDQLDDLVTVLTKNITDWSQANGIVFGGAPVPSGGQLVFDITLYAELSGVNTPVLRLGYLYVSSSDIALIPPAQMAAAQ